jgi:hypothetical protein
VARRWIFCRPAEAALPIATPVASLGPETEEVPKMLWTISIILFVLWLLGLVSSYTLGGWIHILLVFAIILVLVRVISGRKVV